MNYVSRGYVLCFGFLVIIWLRVLCRFVLVVGYVVSGEALVGIRSVLWLRELVVRVLVSIVVLFFLGKRGK